MHRLAAALMLILSLAAGQAVAQPGPEAGAAAAELAKLNVTMREIAELLTRQVEQSGLDLLMKRTQLAQAQVERAEEELKAVEADKASAEEQKSQLDARRELAATQLEQAQPAEREAVQKMWETELATLNLRLRTADAQIVLLQNRIAAAQEEVRGWKTLLDRRLSGQ